MATLEDLQSRTTARQRFVAMLLASFSAYAVLLAALGLHAVLSYSVAEREQEIGIRMALGAERSRVVRLLVGQVAGVTVAGLLAGAAGGAVLTRAMRSLLYGVAPDDPATYAFAVVILLAAAMLAAFLPARRAASIDPASALRHESE